MITSSSTPNTDECKIRESVGSVKSRESAESVKYFKLPADFVYERKNLYLKRSFDIFLSLSLLFLLSPLFLLIILALLLEGLISSQSCGTIFVPQRRVSAGKPFDLIKFCSFNTQEDHLLQDTEDAMWFINERRLTRVGIVLRKFYLDELPQLVNILKGEMSFVGPRPWPEKQYQQVLDTGFQARRLIRGGLCGPLQALKGAPKKPRNIFEVEDKLVAVYLTQSALGVLWVDLCYILRTIRVVFQARGI